MGIYQYSLLSGIWSAAAGEFCFESWFQLFGFFGWAVKPQFSKLCPNSFILNTYLWYI